ncbi:MAG: AAA family ATPase [Rectinemataceae bacterium]|jgi:hypothetical protein
MRFLLENCGPIIQADMELGDLSILVGPQATGKSIALQMLKLAQEYPAIKRTMLDFAYNPSRGREAFVVDYLGEGMSSIWTDDTIIKVGDKKLSYENIKATTVAKREHSVFYVPAQRVTTFDNGWPRRFQNYEASFPYVVREFSEELFKYLDKAYASDSSGRLFPHPKSLRKSLKDSLAQSVYRNATLSLDKEHSRKRLVLQPSPGVSLPMATWSAGQREFTPLMLGLYRLLPSAAKGKDEKIKQVIIEEPEMGLHPRAIRSLMYIVMELLYRGYSVVLSTHSSAILEIAWALSLIGESSDPLSSFCRLFGETKKKTQEDMASSVLKKSIRVHYFKPVEEGKTFSIDISGMDPAGITDEADWGGLTEQSSLIGEIVAESAPSYGAKAKQGDRS